MTIALQQQPVGRIISSAEGAEGFARLIPILLIFSACLLPQELRLEIAGQTLYAPRIAGFVVLPWLLGRTAAEPYRFRLLDGFFLFGIMWIVVSFTVVYGAGEGVLRGGALAIDAAIPYLAARAAIRNTTDLRRFLILISPGLAMVAAILPLESLSHTYLVKPAFERWMGALPASGEGLRSITESGLPTRLGLLRATGPFSHPIIAGIFLAGMLPLYFTSAIKGWPRAFGIGAGILAFFSLSSAAFLALLLCVALLAYDWLQRRVTFLSWPLLAFSVVLIVAFLELAANSGAIGVLSRFTFDPQTAHFRMLIWDYGTVSVASHPFLGIGYEPYERASWMNPSVDNYWLLLAIRHGLPTVLAIMVVLISAIALLVLQSRGKEEGDRRIYIGYAIALFIYLVTGFTVAFFGAIVPLFYILLGGAISLVVPQRL